MQRVSDLVLPLTSDFIGLSYLLVSEPELTHAPGSYRDTVRAKLNYDVKRLLGGRDVGDHPNHNNLSLSV